MWSKKPPSKTLDMWVRELISLELQLENVPKNTQAYQSILNDIKRIQQIIEEKYGKGN